MSEQRIEPCRAGVKGLQLRVMVLDASWRPVGLRMEAFRGKEKAMILGRQVPRSWGKMGKRMGARLKARAQAKAMWGPHWASKQRNTTSGSRRALGFSKGGHRHNRRPKT